MDTLHDAVNVTVVGRANICACWWDTLRTEGMTSLNVLTVGLPPIHNLNLITRKYQTTWGIFYGTPGTCSLKILRSRKTHKGWGSIPDSRLKRYGTEHTVIWDCILDYDRKRKAVKDIMGTIAVRFNIDCGLDSNIVWILKVPDFCPGWCSSVDWVWAANQRVAGSIPSRAHAWVAGQVPSCGCVRGNHTPMFLSLSFSLPPLLS